MTIDKTPIALMFSLGLLMGNTAVYGMDKDPEQNKHPSIQPTIKIENIEVLPNGNVTIGNITLYNALSLPNNVWDIPTPEPDVQDTPPPSPQLPGPQVQDAPPAGKPSVQVELPQQQIENHPPIAQPPVQQIILL